MTKPDMHEVEIIYTTPLKGREEPTLIRFRVPGGWCYESITYSLYGGEVMMAKSMTFVPDPRLGYE